MEAGAVVTLATNKQQKSVGGLTSRAGVTSKFVGVKPLDQDLMRIPALRNLQEFHM